MLKKSLGGLTLLVFTFTFAVPLFVGVNTANATPTIVHTQNWRTDFFCPDGTYATSSSGTHESTYYHGHPEDDCDWTYTEDSPYLTWLCAHTDHETTYHHNDTLDYTTVTLWSNSNYCD